MAYPRGGHYPYDQRHIGYSSRRANQPDGIESGDEGNRQDNSQIARDAGLTYTRYSEDVTFSTAEDFERPKAVSVVRATTAVLRAIGLTVNEKKTRIVPPRGEKGRSRPPN